MVQTDRAGCIRLSLSPLGFDPLGRPGLDDEERQALAAKPGQRTARQRETLAELYRFAAGSSDPAWSAVKPLCLKLAECNDGKTHTMVTKAMPPLVTRVLLPRGNWQDQTGPVVEPAVPHFPPRHTGAKDGRLTPLDLARWLTAPEDPLTARVFMNRIWKQHFGTGISSQVEDVGAQGEWPLHPELLDWLALEFRENCLMARRLAERGVRMIQLYHRAWDHHGDIERAMPIAAREVNQACAALVRDLDQRGMLDDTLILWGGEFGRTPMGQGSGRDHHILGFSIWMAGGGIKGGVTYGATDELGYRAVDNALHVRDLHATVLHLCGIDHTRLSFKFQGLDVRLTGVEPARVITELLA